MQTACMLSNAFGKVVTNGEYAKKKSVNYFVKTQNNLQSPKILS